MSDDNQIKSEDKQSLPSDEGQKASEPVTQAEEAPVQTEPETSPDVIATPDLIQGKQSSQDENLTQIATASPDGGPRNDNEKNATSQTEVLKNDDSAVEPATPSKSDTAGKWYVVHTYSGHENKVAVALKQRIESERLEGKIFEVLVPMQDKIEIRAGKKATVKEKIFPGYILVKMILDDASWLAVRTTQGVTSFVGIGNKPTPISDAEVATIVRFTKEEAPTFKQVFAIDDTVKIVDGPFAEFIGKVDTVDEEKGKVKVLVSIFGRETPVELDFLQVQKI